LDPPFQTAGSDGRPSGLAIDLVREAARRRGIRLEWIPKPEGPETAMLGNAVDLWPFLTLTPERTKLFHITDAFLETELCLLVPAASRFTRVSDLAQGAISLQDMPINLRWVHATLPDARLLPMPTTRDAVSQVCQGRADAAFLEEYNAVETLLSGGSCANVELRWITVPDKRSRLGVGSTFAAGRAADAIRDEIACPAR